MRFFLLSICLYLCVGLHAQSHRTSTSMPTPESILDAMNLANNWFIRKHPDAAAPTFVKKERPSNLWTRGVYFEGLSELNRIHPQNQNIRYMNQWAQAHQFIPRNGVTTRDADDYCCSQAYLDMYLDSLHLFRELHIINPTEQCMNNLINHRLPSTDSASSGDTQQDRSSLHDWTWVDAIQMGLPVLSKLARIFYLQGLDGAESYVNQGWFMYQWTRDSLAGGLFNAHDGLWWRDKDFVPPYREPNGENCYWSRGNGWAYAALVRAMDAALKAKGVKSPDWREPLLTTKWDILPYEAHFNQYKADFLLMTQSLLKCQRKDFFWNVSLHDESNYGGPELTGTALFLYGMAWGIRHNFLPQKKYLPIVIHTWNAIVRTCLHSDGALGYVQGTGKEPKDSQPVTYDSLPDFDDFGLGCFLLAGSEMYKLTMILQNSHEYDEK